MDRVSYSASLKRRFVPRASPAEAEAAMLVLLLSARVPKRVGKVPTNIQKWSLAVAELCCRLAPTSAAE